jgi:hypothetical protein
MNDMHLCHTEQQRLSSLSWLTVDSVHEIEIYLVCFHIKVSAPSNRLRKLVIIAGERVILMRMTRLKRLEMIMSRAL